MGRPTLKTRKPIDRLTPADLVAFPIWEFAIDEEDEPDRDETWVRPVAGRVIARGQMSLSVAAEITTSSGRHLKGFVGVSTDGSVELTDAVVLEDKKYLFVASRFPNTRAALAEALGLTEAEVFPLRFTLRALVEGERKPRGGTIK